MALLFVIEGRKVTPNAETLLISPFKDIWERDKSKDKKVAIAELTYIEFMTSMLESNPYKQYTEERKPVKIKEEIIFMKSWKPDKFIKQAMDKIVLFQTEGSTNYSYYIAAKRAAEKMKTFFLEVDITERNIKTGNPIYKPKDLTAALNDTERTLNTLKNLEKKVQEELYETIKTKADKKISIFANPSSLK